MVDEFECDEEIKKSRQLTLKVEDMTSSVEDFLANSSTISMACLSALGTSADNNKHFKP